MPIENASPAFPHRILLLEESFEQSASQVGVLKQEWPDSQLDIAPTREEFVASLRHFRPDLVISAFSASGFDTWSALDLLRRHAPETPFVIFTGSVGEENAVELIKAGAADVIMKSQLSRLVPAIRRILGEREIRECGNRARLLAERAIRAREEMLAVVSHDLKSPLATILLLAESGLRELKHRPETFNAQEMERSMERIRRSATLMQNLILDVLDHARVEAGNFALTKRPAHPKRVVEEIDDIFGPIARDKGIQLAIESSIPGEVEGVFDPDKSFQAFSNLVSNAVKFTPEGGKILVTAEIFRSQLVFSVQDSGPGVPEALKDRIFDKFFQAKDQVSKGSGLGLYIARRIAEAHDGGITLESSSAGSRFTIRIPFPLQASRDAPAPAAWPTGERMRILFVDDDDDFREVITELLEREGHEVIPACDAESALRLLQETRPLPQTMILDQSLPDLLGTELIRRIRDVPSEEIQAIPMLLMSGDKNLAQIAKEMDLKFYLKKPPTLIELTKAVSAMSEELATSDCY